MKNFLNPFTLFSFCFFIIIINSCDNNNDDTIANNTISSVTNIVTSGTWKITNYNDSGTDETSDFAGYNFTFNSNGVLTANNGTNSYNGNWSVADSNSNDDSISDLDFNILFTAPAKFADISDDWDIQEKNSNVIKLVDVSGGNGGTDYLTFTKKLKYVHENLFAKSSILFYYSFSQEDLLGEIDTLKAEELYQPSFKALQIVTAQSTKMPAKKEFYLVISHRFGDISEGTKNFFGLDNATTKIGGIYGITEAIAVSLSRHTYNKTYEIGAKYRLWKQSKEQNMPFDIAGYHVLDINSELDQDTYPNIRFSDRLSYTTQILISRRFNENFSLQLTPSFVHKNLFDPAVENENNFFAGFGGRYKISKRLSINAEYYYNFNDKELYRNPLSLGLDIETGGHVFQLLFSNSQPNTEAGYLTNAIGDWGKGKIYFGFNLYRVF